jgi:predicted ribosome quality control (RQC) complex YloA/Tae2 family protein
MSHFFRFIAGKTLVAVSKALITAEKKIAQDLKATKATVATIRTIRKPYWFEKFYWFVSSENYLVLGARDVAQSEILVKK